MTTTAKRYPTPPTQTVHFRFGEVESSRPPYTRRFCAEAWVGDREPGHFDKVCTHVREAPTDTYNVNRDYQKHIKRVCIETALEMALGIER